MFAKIRKKSERLKEKTFKTFKTTLCYQLYMSMATVKIYFLTFIELKLRWTSPLKVSGDIKPVFMLEPLDS